MTMSVKVLPRMASITAPPAEHSASVTSALNLILIESFSLYLKTRRIASFLSAPHLRAYFLLLEDQAKQVLEMTDAVVERICEIDPLSLGTMGDFVRHGCFIGRQPHGPLHSMLMSIRDENLEVATSLSSIKSGVVGMEDLTSLTLIDLWIEEAERRAEFLFETSRI